jgi:cobaltochelatase CobT
MTRPTDRSDIFKSALSAATRALAGQDELAVDFSVDGGRMQDGQITLTTPPKDLTPVTAARARGQADALALKVAHHDARRHARAMPQREDARRLFEAAERARIESIGAAAMDGVAENLDAVLQQRCERAGYSRVTDRSRAPMDDALEFVLRETMTGRNTASSCRVSRGAVACRTGGEGGRSSRPGARRDGRSGRVLGPDARPPARSRYGR